MENKSLFPIADQDPGIDKPHAHAPLADRLRPSRLEEIRGQDHLLGEGAILSEVIRSDRIPSMILWGPPGVGKTTIARSMAALCKADFISVSAVLAGIKDVRRVAQEAETRLRSAQKKTILFIDEIHRFNKAQQDALLPHVESGLLTLIGATTENPSFEVISPLLSRCRVFVLKSLTDADLLDILKQALQDPVRGLGTWNLKVEPKALESIAAFANGDARQALNSLEVSASLARSANRSGPVIDTSILKTALQKRTLLYDKSGEEHFNLISALHKSLRNSDPDAAIYWLGRMLEAGEDPHYLLRRMVRFASEDVGLADPAAVGYAVDAWAAFDRIGLPEGKLSLVQLAAYLAKAPKSNAVYRAYGEVQKDVQSTRNDPVPLHLRNAPTKLMKEIGYGKGYRYAHDEGGRVEEMECLPENLKGRKYLKE